MTRFTDGFILNSLCYVLNNSKAMVIETKNDQEIIYFGDKLLTKED